jgi:(1->4)-alpha-D-glucan 1-alpha-D-glucosylmutase
LRVRRDHATASTTGEYLPLWAAGPKASHLVAFQRGSELITLAPRLVMTRGDWAGTVLELPEGTWKNHFTGESFPGGKTEIASLLQRFPVALLTRESRT